MLAINHLGPFLLTNELRPLLESSAPAARRERVVERAQDGEDSRPSASRHAEELRRARVWPVRGNQVDEHPLDPRASRRRLDGTRVTANALHPGGVRTNLGNPPKPVIAVVGLFLVSPEKGAATSLYLATDPGVDGITGAYWAKSRRADGKLTSAARDDDLARRLWAASEDLVAPH